MEWDGIPARLRGLASMLDGLVSYSVQALHERVE